MLNKGFTVWLTGLSGSGKTTIARVLQRRLMDMGYRAELLDGDEVRKNLSPDLGFTKQDRETHARRVVYISKLLARNGVIALVSLISPYRAFRAYAREELKDFVEVYVKCSIDTCIKRDPKGLYKKALNGEIPDMTGIQDPYEEPLNPEITVDTDRQSVEECVNIIMDGLRRLGYITAATAATTTTVQVREAVEGSGVKKEGSS
ncbi:MAG: adenylyl-sulfate kinase [Candidatus Nitrosocaldus sp.]|nr:adenylyl-sulfate kinase [Candidatus Nitrosocaldus sp.]